MPHYERLSVISGWPMPNNGMHPTRDTAALIISNGLGGRVMPALCRFSCVIIKKTTDLIAEAERATELLAGKIVARVTRHREAEVMIEFTDGTRLYVDGGGDGVELSIVGVGEE